MDQLTAMKVLVAVVEERSFAGAAEKLGISRAMASKHVMDLEAHLNARLLYRTTRRQSLTDTGQIYYERSKRILSRIAEADQEASLQSLTPKGRLRINAPVSFGVSHVAPKIKDYLQNYSDVEIELTLNDRYVDLVDEGFDVAIRIGGLRDSSLIARKLAQCRIVVCAAPAYLAAHGAPNHPNDLSAHNCLLYAYGDSPGLWRFQKGHERFSIRVPSHLTSNNGGALAAAAISGLGITIQPAFIVSQALQNQELTEILQDFDAGELVIHAVYPHSRLVSARVRTFIDYLVATYKSESLWKA